MQNRQQLWQNLDRIETRLNRLTSWLQHQPTAQQPCCPCQPPKSQKRKNSGKKRLGKQEYESLIKSSLSQLHCRLQRLGVTVAVRRHKGGAIRERIVSCQAKVKQRNKRMSESRASRLSNIMHDISNT